MSFPPESLSCPESRPQDWAQQPFPVLFPTLLILALGSLGVAPGFPSGGRHRPVFAPSLPKPAAAPDPPWWIFIEWLSDKRFLPLLVLDHVVEPSGSPGPEEEASEHSLGVQWSQHWPCHCGMVGKACPLSWHHTFLLKQTKRGKKTRFKLFF